MAQNCKIKELSIMERPYEKCMHHGAASLSNEELLAVLLRTGVKGMNSVELAHHLLYNQNNDDGILNIHHLTPQKLKKIRGIGNVKTVQILCVSELAKRLAKATAYHALEFHNPSSIATYYMEDLRHRKQEVLKLLMLNTKSKLIGESDISKGTVNASLISPRELFLTALEHEAVSIILLHNHPSGDPNPSKEDFLLTQRVKEAGELLGVELLDHIIIGNNCYISFAEQQMI